MDEISVGLVGTFFKENVIFLSKTIIALNMGQYGLYQQNIQLCECYLHPNQRRIQNSVTQLRLSFLQAFNYF